MTYRAPELAEVVILLQSYAREASEHTFTVAKAQGLLELAHRLREGLENQEAKIVEDQRRKDDQGPQEY